MTSKVVPASAGGQGCGGDIADGGGLQSRGGHARAHEEHLGFAVDLFCGPSNMLMSAEYIKKCHQQVVIICQCKTKRHSHCHKKKKTKNIQAAHPGATARYLDMTAFYRRTGRKREIWAHALLKWEVNLKFWTFSTVIRSRCPPGVRY